MCFCFVCLFGDLLTSSDSLLVCCSSGWTPSTASKTVTGLAGRESDSLISDTSLSENHDCTWRLLSALSTSTCVYEVKCRERLCMFARAVPYRIRQFAHRKEREKRREDREKWDKTWEEHIQIKTNNMKQQQQQQYQRSSGRRRRWWQKKSNFFLFVYNMFPSTTMFDWLFFLFRWTTILVEKNND